MSSITVDFFLDLFVRQWAIDEELIHNIYSEERQ